MAALVDRLRALRVRLWEDNGQLRFEAPAGIMTDELAAEIRQSKPALLEFLRDARAGAASAPPAIATVPRGGVMPASMAQQRLWLLHQLDGNGSTYNVPKAMRLRGALDAARLERAFETVVHRHEALRTTFEWQRGEAVQRIHAPSPIHIQYEDLSASGEPERMDRARRLAAGLAAAPFDLTQGPPFRIGLLKLAEDDHVAVIVMHHISTDGRSLEILFEEAAAVYASPETPLPPLPVQYADYAAFERERLGQPQTAADIEWWKEQLSGAPPLLELPTDRPRPASQTFKGSARNWTAGSALLDALTQTARSRETTMATLITGALALLLSRYSGQDEVSLGCPVENREWPEIQRLIGVFTNTIVLRLSVAGDPLVSDFLDHVKATTLAAIEHQQVPFEKLVEALQPDRTHGNTPLFQAAISWLDARKGMLALPDIAIEPFEFEFGAVKFDLNIEAYHARGILHLTWFYRQDLFDDATAGRMIGHLERLLWGIATQPAVRVSELNLVTEQERRLLDEWNRTAVAPPAAASVVDLFEEQVRRTPGAVAAVDGERTLTYRELDQRANSAAVLLQEAGAGPGTVVALLMDHSLELICAVLGILKCGAAYLPLDHAAPEQRLKTLLKDSNAAAVLVAGPHMRRRASSLHGNFLDLPQTACETVRRSTSASQPAYVIYTSGSTGSPKGVVVDHGNLLHYIHWAARVYTGGEALAFAFFTSLSFDLTVTSLFVPLVTGGRIAVYREERGVPAIFRIVRSQEVDIVKLTPSHLALIKDMDLSGTRIRRLILGGEDLKSDLCRRIHESAHGAIEILNEYGPTETTVGCMLHRFDPEARSTSVPIGKPAGNTRLFVLDANRQPVPIGIPGELYIAGAGVAQGYLGQPELTAGRFLPAGEDGGKMYRSGDLARWRPDGILEYLGRRDEQVKIRGYRIDTGDVAAALASHPAIADCHVLLVSRGAAATPQSKAAARHCMRCGLASNYPGTVIDSAGVCDTCHAFEANRERVESYFRTPEDFDRLLEAARARRSGGYDCLVLLSGGKDSTYMLSEVVARGARPLAYTLDPGYLSEGARENIREVTARLGADHLFGSTPHMNEIFAESLERHANVCNGCFKTLYTLSLNLAKERGIPLILTGLSRGQLFETRLSKYYNVPDFDGERVDRAVLEARKIYHRLNDAIARRLPVRIFENDRIFEEVEIVDFYRYFDVSLGGMLAHLERRLGWRRPADTGRSTNCRINDAGIYVHQQRLGYHNYALPYSWDVRMGHKQRDEALDELEDEIDVPRVRAMLDEVGYREPASPAGEPERALCAYYTANAPVTAEQLRTHMAALLPPVMIPSAFLPVERIPLTRNGKADRRALPPPEWAPGAAREPVPPRTPAERTIAAIWSSFLGFDRIGIHDSFFQLGGHSLMATGVVARMMDSLAVDLPISLLFEKPTIAELAAEVASRTR